MRPRRAQGCSTSITLGFTLTMVNSTRRFSRGPWRSCWCPWACLAVAHRLEPLGGDALDDEALAHGVGAALGQVQVGAVLALVVGVALHAHQLDLRVGLSTAPPASAAGRTWARMMSLSLAKYTLSRMTIFSPSRRTFTLPLSGQPSSSFTPLMVSGSLGHLSSASRTPSCRCPGPGSRPRPRSRPCPRRPAGTGPCRP